MSRSIQEERLLRLLKSELNEEPISREEQETLFGGMIFADWDRIMELAGQNRVYPLLMGALMRNREIPVPMQIGRYLQQVTVHNSMAFYQKLGLVGALLKDMQLQNVTGCVLKGITLSALFPTPESRTFSDIDLYIPQREQYDRMVRSFEEGGYARKPDDMTDHHESFYYSRQGMLCDVELHYRLNTTWGNKKLDSALDAIYREAMSQGSLGEISVMGMQVPTLPVTLEALYLLMHLFQHFMNKGFGIRLFLDWTVFWRREQTRVDEAQLAQWIRQLHLEYFLDAVNGICADWLGMPLPGFGWLSGQKHPELEEELLEDVFAGGDFGHEDRNRMVVTSRKASIKAYFMELHRQTVRHYPKASEHKLLRPLLWVWTALVFQYNNVFRRRISLMAVLSSTGQRSRLAQKFHIFDES